MSRLFNYQSFQTFECLDCSTLQTFECRDCSTQSFQTFECLGCLTVTKPRIEHHKWKVEFGAQRGAARQLRSIFGALLLDLHNREDFALALFPGLAQPERLRPRYSQDLLNREDINRTLAPCLPFLTHWRSSKTKAQSNARVTTRG